jgi:WD40 repeat protein/tRNA A-37 threonylcarbamoyl transferase component Bud32
VHVSDDPRAGTELAGYRIESLLGWGGMSIVYLAEDLRLKRKVALKLLAAELADDETFRERFLRESELAASIDHPSIVPIYGAGTTGNRLFIAMRYVEGRDLKERLRSGRLDPAIAIGILAQVASALDAAHARGLVHRDVKPSNVLLDTGARPDGSDHAYLADFGLTRHVSETTTRSDDASVLGTIDYVAPEQITGDEVDGRADVYSLGCVLYECLVGQPPFGRESELAVVFSHLEAEPPAPSVERPELPTALDAVIARALAKEPERRHGSCRELVQAALAVSVDEASRLLVEVASRAAAGRSDLGVAEAELADRVIDLQLAREQARMLAGPPTPARIAAEGACPFKGLASFEPVDAEYFFGRERLVAELVAHLVGTGFLGIVGPSGSGKSSVLRAGLLPALAGGVLPGSEGWRRVLLRPGERPLQELRRILVSGAPDPLAEALDALPGDGRLLLAVDQLEELFTACHSDSERSAFAKALARAASDPDGRAVVVAALRADFYGRFAAYPELAALLGANQVLVGPLQASELRRVVELPASRVGLRVEPELVDVLAGDVDGQPGALPLLSTALLELWQKREDTTLTLDAYRESGGVHGAVARLAEGTYARIADDRKALVRAIMLRLVGQDDGDTPVRRRAPLAELELERHDDIRGVLETLADSRLVTVSEGSVEVAHEALLREWPRLREWIEEDAEGRRLRRHVTQAAAEWEAADHDEGELYRGVRLAAALDWSTEHALDLNDLEREFVSESRETSEREARRARRTNRRLRGLLAGVAALLVAAVVGALLAVVQRGEARDAATAQLAERLGAQALVEEDLDLSLLLSRQAVAIDDSPQTRGYLLAALQRSPAAIGIMHGSGGTSVLRGIDVSPDGQTLAVADSEVGLLLFDTTTYEQIDKVTPNALTAGAVAFSPDGAAIAFGGTGYIGLVDAGTREQLADARIDSGAARIEFTADGSRLVVVEFEFPPGDDGQASIVVRDASTLRPIGSPIRPDGFDVTYIAEYKTAPPVVLTPDGGTLVVATPTGELGWWDLASGERTRSLEIPRGQYALALSPDGLTAAVGLDSGIELIDVRTAEVRRARGLLPSAPLWLAFSPDGKTVVSTTISGTVTVWDAEALIPIETLRGHSRAVQQPVFSPDGRTLYTASHDGTVVAWDMSGDRRLGRGFTFTEDGGAIWADWHPGAFSPDGALIAVGLTGDGIGLRDAMTLKPAGAPLRGTQGEVNGLAFAPDGRTLVAVSQKGFATIWDVGSRSLRPPFAFGVDSYALGVSVSADGRTFATAGGSGVAIRDVVTGTFLASVGDGDMAGDVAFSPTEPLVAFAREGTRGANRGDAEIWSVPDGSSVGVMRPVGGGEDYFTGWAVAFSPDGRLLASPRDDGSVGIWDVHSGGLVRAITPNVGAAVLGLDFSPDGRMLAVSGGDSFASLWDVANGSQIGPRLTAGGRGATVDFSPDGRRLLEIHANGRGAVWDVDPESWKRRACGVANRTLTREEWNAFLPGRAYAPACTT